MSTFETHPVDMFSAVENLNSTCSRACRMKRRDISKDIIFVLLFIDWIFLPSTNKACNKSYIMRNGHDLCEISVIRVPLVVAVV